MITIKNNKKEFVVLNLTDPQLSFSDWDDEHTGGKIVKYTIAELVKRVKPDLITVTGDLAWAGSLTSYKNLATELEKTNTPWSVVWGNHDNQKGPECVKDTIEIYKQFPHFTYESGNPSMGDGNYVILIEDSKDKIALIMLDSHDREKHIKEDGEVENAWARLWPCQLDWYEDTIQSLKKCGCNESIMMLHIPIYAYRDAFKAAFNKIVLEKEMIDKESYNGTYWNDGYKDSFGVCHDNICSYPEDDCVFDLIQKYGHTKTVVCGHDHVNNWVIQYKGVKFVYGLKTGSGCYWEPSLSGGTVITVSDGTVKDIHHEFNYIRFRFLRF
ncbi:MAG: metallophosphoesterase, partial [Clostridia bacterium]|nr:metallophosphoesterase [Clostridia bacterium]